MRYAISLPDRPTVMLDSRHGADVRIIAEIIAAVPSAVAVVSPVDGAHVPLSVAFSASWFR